MGQQPRPPAQWPSAVAPSLGSGMSVQGLLRRPCLVSPREQSAAGARPFVFAVVPREERVGVK